MWVRVTKEQFDFIAMTMRNNRKGYEWHTGCYTSIKLKMEDWLQYFPSYVPELVHNYCLTTRHDVYYFDTLKQLLDRWLPLAGLLGVRGWKINKQGLLS